MSKQDLFNYMAQDHNILLLESEIDEIELIVTASADIKHELISAFHEMSLNRIEFNYRSVCDVVERVVK